MYKERERQRERQQSDLTRVPSKLRPTLYPSTDVYIILLEPQVRKVVFLVEVRQQNICRTSNCKHTIFNALSPIYDARRYSIQHPH